MGGVPLRRYVESVDEHLLPLVLLSVAVGVAVPPLAALAALSTPILAVMIGSISLTLSPAAFRGVDRRALGVVLLAQASMPAAAFALARLLELSPALTAGFVVVAAVTPELVTPVMTELAGGDTALASAVLVVVGLGSVAFVPLVAGILLPGPVAFDRHLVVRELAVAVVLPMAAAVGARWRWPARVGRHDALYPSVSAAMVVLIIGIVAAANAPLLRSAGPTLASVLLGAAALNGFGYAAGWLAGVPFDRETRIAAALSIGMRDFAVAAALLVSAGFPPAATLPAVVFGIVEMVSSAGAARWLTR